MSGKCSWWAAPTPRDRPPSTSPVVTQPAWARITIDQGDAMGQPSRLRAAALAGPHGITRTSVTGHAVRTGRDDLDLDTITRGRDLPGPELR